MPVSGGRAASNVLKASSSPADAPTPTTGNGSARCRLASARSSLLAVEAFASLEGASLCEDMDAPLAGEEPQQITNYHGSNFIHTALLPPLSIFRIYKPYPQPAKVPPKNI